MLSSCVLKLTTLKFFISFIKYVRNTSCNDSSYLERSIKTNYILHLFKINIILKSTAMHVWRLRFLHDTCRRWVSFIGWEHVYIDAYLKICTNPIYWKVCLINDKRHGLIYKWNYRTIWEATMNIKLFFWISKVLRVARSLSVP